MKELVNIQSMLKAPKGQYNSFAKYRYRSCEDILEALKPLLKKSECTLVLTDRVQMVGDRYYIEATATLTNKDGQQVSASALAQEPAEKKGMDAAQVTGTSSSYARKYALNGLFCIDDSRDIDSMPHTEVDYGKQLRECKSLAELQSAWKGIPSHLKPSYQSVKDEMKIKLSEK